MTDDDSDMRRAGRSRQAHVFAFGGGDARVYGVRPPGPDAMNIKKIKRVVQTIVDQILNEETSLVGLTTIRDYDEYTFTHSVNVCIFSVALGRRLGLTRLQLFDLGLAALFTTSASRACRWGAEQVRRTTDEDWRWLPRTLARRAGACSRFAGCRTCRIAHGGLLRAPHEDQDLTGIPSVRPREQSIFSKIVAVADGFDGDLASRTRRCRCPRPPCWPACATIRGVASTRSS